MELVVCVRHYDYFGGEKREMQVYENLLEGWSAYKKGISIDFDYGDAFRETSYYVKHDYSVALKPQRWHARSKYEWDRICKELEEKKFREEHNDFSAAEMEFLSALFDFNTMDEEIVI